MRTPESDLLPIGGADAPPQTGPRQPMFGDDRGLLVALLVIWTLITLWKAAIAAVGNVIWEEAHFVVLGQHLDWGYTDVPAGWPLFARLCTTLFGWSPLAVRLPGLVISQAIPLAVYFAARPLAPRREALWAALLSLLIPPLTISGTVFYPEGAEQLLFALMLGCAVRAMEGRQLRWWALTGACGAFGLFIHDRFVMAGVGIVVFALVSREGRRLWLQPGFWLAGVIAAAGAVPALIYNMREHWPTLQYQVANRPSAAHGGFDLGQLLAFTIQQAGICTPVFFIALLAAAWRARRRARDGDAGAGLYFWAGVTVLGVYTGLSSVDRQIMPHWPFMAYLAFLPFLPATLIAYVNGPAWPHARPARAFLIGLGPALALVFAIGATVFEAAWTHPDLVPPAYRIVLQTRLEDWRQLETPLRRAEAVAASRFGGEPAVTAASGHIPALRLEFPGVAGRRVYALDEPYDEFTRFVLLRRQWGLDEQGLRRDHAGGPVVLAMPETDFMVYTKAETDFRRRVCGEIADLALFETVELPPGRVAVDLYTGRVRPTPLPLGPSDDCPLIPRLSLAEPTRGATLPAEEPFSGHGVAADPKRIASIDILMDGRVVAPARYFLDPKGGARVSEALSFDPDYPRLQFDFRVPGAVVTPGEHRLSVRATRPDGSTFEGATRTLYAR